MLTGPAIEKALKDAGILKIEIIPWELDEGELGISIEWTGGQSTAHPVKALGDISNRLKKASG